jgi:UDP-N-acetylglucosamine--N-acetylmuramyl-(pentapeptide) pyrophosphoryl-undecaprenol N-acetylglucosamine transferase
VLLVFGGSQGARTLNEAVSGAAEQLAAAGISVLHAHGPKNTITLPSPTDGAPYVAVPYLSRMDLAYAAADAAICRSGAMTVAEVSAVGLPAIYVPLPHGNGEQELNAKPIVAQGGGRIVPDAELTPDYIVNQVIPMLRDRERLLVMSRAAADAGHRDAAVEVARIVLEVARG